jgi:DNA-binding winged helix-turn-helix (wHTH) protein
MTRKEKHLFEFGPFQADPNLRILLRDGQLVPAPPKAFDILLTLLQNNDKLILKEDLMKAVWPDSFVEESNLTQNIFVLRKILGETAGGPRYIITLPRRGYRFAGEVRTVSEEDEPRQAVAEIPSALPPVIEVERGRADKNVWLLLAVSIVIVAVLTGLAALMYPLPPPPKALGVHQITHSGRVEPGTRVVTDGSRLYFTERIGGAGVLAEAPVAGGEPTLIFPTCNSMTLIQTNRGC